MPRFSAKRAKPSVITLADQARDQGQWERAARYYRQALQRRPQNPPIWVQYGHVLKESGHWTESEKAYRRAIAYDPGSADAHLHLGQIFKIQGKKEEARSAYMHALALDPSLNGVSAEFSQLGWSEAHFSEFRGMLSAADEAYRKGKTDEAADAYLRASVLDPSLEDAARELSDPEPSGSLEPGLKAHSSHPKTIQRNAANEDMRVIGRVRGATDAVYALVLGRLPESTRVNREYSTIEVADELIASAEFRKQVLDSFRWHGKLPHENLYPEDRHLVIEVAKQAGLDIPDEETASVDWEKILYAVLGTGPGYDMLHRHHGPAAGHFVSMLQRAVDRTKLPEGFDPFLYLKANPDVAAAGGDPVEHFLGRGRLENRRLRPNYRPIPDDFDPEYFLDTRPSAALATSFPLRDGTLPWPTHAFHFAHCDHDKLYRNRAIISYLYLKGNGIEVKAWNAPFPKRRDSIVYYVDSLTGEQLRARFPHLAGLAFVKPDILDNEQTLPSLLNDSKDFAILSGVLPYFENPILALQNACRVVKPGGTVCMAVPDKRYGIDVRRPVTDLEHFWQDYRQGPEVSRRDHYEEFIATVLNGDPPEPPIHPERLIYSQYPIHFHVWTHHSFIRFIENVVEQLPLGCEIELACRNEIETICVLRKLYTERMSPAAS